MHYFLFLSGACSPLDRLALTLAPLCGAVHGAFQTREFFMTEVILVAAIAAAVIGLRLYTFIQAVREGDFADPIGRAYALGLATPPPSRGA